MTAKVREDAPALVPISVMGTKKLVVINKTYTSSTSPYRVPCEIFVSPRILAKALEITLAAKALGKSLRNEGLEFLRRVLLLKQAREVLDAINNLVHGSRCFVQASLSDGNAQPMIEELRHRTPIQPSDLGLKYYINRLCLSNTTIPYNRANIQELEELIIASQTLTLEDRWPKCNRQAIL